MCLLACHFYEEEAHFSRRFLRVFVLSNIAFISARHRCTAGLGVWWWTTVAASRHLLVLAGINPLIVPNPDINNNNTTCGQWSVTSGPAICTSGSKTGIDIYDSYYTCMHRQREDRLSMCSVLYFNLQPLIARCSGDPS